MKLNLSESTTGSGFYAIGTLVVYKEFKEFIAIYRIISIDIENEKRGTIELALVDSAKTKNINNRLSIGKQAYTCMIANGAIRLATKEDMTEINRLKLRKLISD